MAALLLLAGVARPAPAVETTARVQAGVAAGYDANPLRVSGGSEGGGFTELRLDLALGVDLGDRTGLFVDLDGRQRRHVTDLSDADFLTARARAGFNWTPWRSGRRHLSLAGGGSYGLQRLTFIDRATGAVYEIVEDPSATPPVIRSIPDRLDVDRAGAFLNLRARLSRRVRVFLDTALERNDYAEDYDGSNVLESLDHDRLTLTPGVRLILHSRARLTLSVTGTMADYDERLARDLAGDPAPGVLNEYRYITHRASLDLLPGRSWETSFGVNTVDREDPYAGYYNYGGTALFAFVKNSFTPRTTWQLFASYRELDYENATVSSAPDSEFRSSDAMRFVGRVEHSLTDSLLFFAEGGYQNSDSNDPDYTYERDWAMAGFRYRR